MDYSPLRWKRTFFIIWCGQAVSLVGSSAAQFAIIWWLTVQTGSAAVLATASLVGFLPPALIGPFAGVWVDRMSRKTVMIVADLAIAVASTMLALAFLLGTPAIWFVYLILFARSIGSVFHSPAMQAAMPMLVPPSELTKTGGWSMFLLSGSAMAGPVLGAVFMAAFAMPAVMLIDVVGALLAVAALAAVSIPDPETDPSARQHVLREILDGLRLINENRMLKAITWPMLLAMLVFVPVGSLFPLMVSSHFGGTAWHASAVEFVFAGGLLASSLVLGIWGGAEHRLVMIAGAISALGAVLAVAGLLPPTAFAAFVVLSAIMGFTGSFFQVPYFALIQTSVPPEALGRVFALLGSMMSLATPLGLLIAGPVAEVVGVAAWFAISGTLMLLTGVLGYVAVRLQLAAAR